LQAAQTCSNKSKRLIEISLVVFAIVFAAKLNALLEESANNAREESKPAFSEAI
jgi:hypothetical protein